MFSHSYHLSCYNLSDKKYSTSPEGFTRSTALPGRFRGSSSHLLSLVNNYGGKEKGVVNGTSNQRECRSYVDLVEAIWSPPAAMCIVLCSTFWVILAIFFANRGALTVWPWFSTSRKTLSCNSFVFL